MNTILEIPLRVTTIVLTPPLTDEEFEKLCFTTEAQLERTKDGTIIVNPPTAGGTSDRNSDINYQLRAWWYGRELAMVFDSNAGFFLPDGSMFSPDAAYTCEAKSERITDEEYEHIFHVVPDFVVELLSGSDSLEKTSQKMETWMSNGVEFGWLVDPTGSRFWFMSPARMSASKREIGSWEPVRWRASRWIWPGSGGAPVLANRSAFAGNTRNP